MSERHCAGHAQARHETGGWQDAALVRYAFGWLCSDESVDAVTVTACPLSDGYYGLPPGKLANAVTWLEMRERPLQALASPLRLRAVLPADTAECDAIYAAIGTRWLWSRVGRPRVGDDFIAHDDDDRPIGVVEFGARGTASVEIIHFGLVAEATGVGLGRRMMAAALELAWPDARRVWLHTCSFDHPGALRFYVGCGFRPYAAGFEIMDDPRSAGVLPLEAAPHVPLVRSGAG